MARREITRREGLDLLARAQVGRVVFVHGALPEVVPVAYRVAGETVVFGVCSGSAFTGDREGAVVAFQVDSFDDRRQCGWYVRAIGVVGPSLTPDEAAVAGAVVPEPWPFGEVCAQVLQIELQVVSGHVIDVVDGAP